MAPNIREAVRLRGQDPLATAGGTPALQSLFRSLTPTLQSFFRGLYSRASLGCPDEGVRAYVIASAVATFANPDARKKKAGSLRLRSGHAFDCASVRLRF